MAINYFKSTDVKVFPCAYRGVDGASVIYDPEASGFNERNFTRIYGMPSEHKKSFLVSWDTTTGNELLKCVIGGYSFEIKNVTYDSLAAKKLAIRLVRVQLGTDDSGDFTTVLDSFKDNELYLDTDISGTHYFTGLAILDDNDSTVTYDADLKLVDKDGNLLQAALRLEDALTNGDGEASLKSAVSGAESKGKCSIALGNGAKALADNAIALGKGAKAGEREHDISSGANAVAIGESTAAKADDSIAIGKGLVAGNISYEEIDDDEYKATQAGESQIVVGKYNEANTNAALIVGWGTGNGARKNILEVSQSGDVKAAGGMNALNEGAKLTSETESGVTTYKLELGKKAANSQGELVIYGNSENSIYASVGAGGIALNGNVTLTNGGITLPADKKLSLRTAGIGGGNDAVTFETSADGTIINSATTTINGDLTVASDKATIIGALMTNGAATIKGDFAIADAEHEYVKFAAGEDETDFDVTADAISLTGKTAIIGDAAITGDVTIGGEGKGNLEVSGSLKGKSLAINGLNFTIDENGNASANGDMAVAGNITAANLSHDESGNYAFAKGVAATGYDISYKENDADKLIKISHGGYSMTDVDGSRTLNNADALLVDTGIHADGNITCAGVFAIGEKDSGLNAETNHVTTKITQGGTAYFKQRLIVGGDQLEVNIADSASDDSATDTFDGYLWVDDKRIIAGGKLLVQESVYAKGNIVSDGDIEAENLNIDNDIIASNGTIVAKNYAAVSDARKKAFIIDYVCGKSILDLPVKEFEFIDDESHAKHIGCLAQDLQEICPELVHEGKDGYLSIEETKLVYLLLKEVKQLKKDIDELKGA